MPAKELDDWLSRVKDIAYPIIAEDLEGVAFHFPSDEVREQYLSTIGNRSDSEIKSILRGFLIKSISVGVDALNFHFYKEIISKGYEFNETEYARRLFLYEKSKASPPPWEGITWVLDLLPDSPREALQVLKAYLMAHWGCLTDGRLGRLYDSMSIIRAWCIESPRNVEEGLELLRSEPPATLEYLVERLYKAMGYQTSLTPRQNDGGYDVLALKREGTTRVVAHIECKRWGDSVGRPILQKLLGVVSDKKATAGICITTGRFTRPAKKFTDDNPRLDCVDGKLLIERLNEHLGPLWYLSLDRLVAESRKACNILHDDITANNGTERVEGSRPITPAAS